MSGVEIKKEETNESSKKNEMEKFLQREQLYDWEKSDQQVPKSVLESTFKNDIEQFVYECMSAYDSSHDFFHILRVRRLALQIAMEEGIVDEEQLALVEVCALLHDVFDHKYNDSKSNSKAQNLQNLFVKYKYSQEKIDLIHHIIEHVSYSKEQKLQKNSTLYSQYMDTLNKQPIIKCVQDADRLDAIGAIGVARTFCYSGSRNVAMFNYCDAKDKNKEKEEEEEEEENKKKENKEKQCSINSWIEAGNANKTTVGHFFEKLLLLKDMMKTKSGRRMAEQKHELMKLFLEHFFQEWKC